MKFSKVAIVLGVIGVIAIIWIDYKVFTAISQLDIEQRGDISPSIVSSGMGAIFPLLFGLLALVLSIVGIVRKEEYRFMALFLSLFIIVFALSPMAILILLIR